MASAVTPINARVRTLPWWVWALVCAGAVLLAYSPVRNADFNWDDDAHITANPVIIGPLGLKEIWTSGKANYFPLTMTSFWLQHAAWGLSPGPYHVVSVLFHVGGALMLWLVLRRLGVPGAWLGAMLWALHPVQAESVAWISELKNTQSGLFYLVSAYFFLRWMQRDESPRFGRDYALSLVAAVLAILSKSSTVMLPVVFGLIGWWRGHRRWRDALWLAPFFAVSLIASGWTIWEQKVNSMASGAEWGHGLASRLMIAGKVPWFYLGKLVWPDPLIFIYPRWEVNELGFVHWIPLLALMGAAWFLWQRRDGPWRPAFVGLGYFFISLFPVLGLFDVFFFRYSFVGDHFQYLASMGPMALAGAGVVALGNRSSAAVETVRAVVAVVLMTALGMLTWKQAGLYRTRETLWQDTVALNPNAWIAQVNLGAEFMSTGRSDRAIPHYEAALRLKPDDPLTEANWGAALIQLGRPQDALPHLETAVRLMPKLAEAHNSLAVAKAALGRMAEAITHAETAVQTKPDFATARVNLATYLGLQARVKEALNHLEEGIRMTPKDAGVRATLGRLLVHLGRTDDAVEQFRTAVRLNPQDFDSLCTLTELLTKKGSYPEALDYGLAALRLRPDGAEGRYLVGNALIRAGRPAEAVAHYEHALRIKPDHLEARANLGSALYQSGRAAEAVPHFERVQQAQPNSPSANSNLGSALMQTGRLPQAIAHFRRAIQLQPDYIEARHNLALALEADGRRDEAMAEYAEILRQNPQHTSAREHLQRLRAATPAPDGRRK